MSKMNSEIKQKWVAALRSGEYEQCKKVLREVGERPTFCCLGVLCDLYTKETNTPWEGLSAFDSLPSDVTVWAGLQGTNTYPSEVSVRYHFPDLPERNIGTKILLTNLNDEVGLTFNQIADIIEAQL